MVRFVDSPANRVAEAGVEESNCILEYELRGFTWKRTWLNGLLNYPLRVSA